MSLQIAGRFHGVFVAIGNGFLMMLDRFSLILRASLFILLATLHASPASAAKVIFVGIYVDEEEPAVDGVWKSKLSKRVAAASEIIGRYADIEFVVKTAGRWQSDNQTLELSKSLKEFEEEVVTDEVRLAIGFTSQFKFRAGRNHLGGTRGPLRHHILIRESAKTVLESERLEVLVHELSHFLCAAHTSDPNSAMRPVVGDGKARSTKFQIGLDPANARIVRLVGQEMRDQRVTKFEDISPRSLALMRNSYLELNRQLPNDPASPQFLRAINHILSNQRDATPAGEVLIPVAPGTIRSR